MAFTLQNIVPWGREFEEYRRMFALDERDLANFILGCGDGPASFNAELTARGGQVVSFDPLYAFSREQIEARIATVRPQIMAQTRAHAGQFVWEYFASPDELEVTRMRAMTLFLEDYEAGSAAGRYVNAALSTLPFADHQFDLALCSHLLFLYSAHLDLKFHLQSLQELLRVAREVRVFPLLDLETNVSAYLQPVLEHFGAERAELVAVDYEFQRRGNQMLRLR